MISVYCIVNFTKKNIKNDKEGFLIEEAISRSYKYPSSNSVSFIHDFLRFFYFILSLCVYICIYK